MAAAQGCRRAPCIDRDPLLLATAQFPEIGDRKPDGTEARGAGLADLERGRQDRVEPASKFDRTSAIGVKADHRQDRAQSVVRHVSTPPLLSLALASAAPNCR